MRISIFERDTSNTPITYDLDWRGLAELLLPHDFSYSDKRDVPCFSPAEYDPGATRSKENTRRIHFGVLDFDKGDVLRIADACEYRHIFCTTWRHSENHPKGRLIVPFSRPVMASEWEAFWPRMNAHFGGTADTKCADASHLYYFPSAPEASRGIAIARIGDGPELDVDALLRDSRKVRVSDLLEYHRELRTAKTPGLLWLRDRLKLLISGDALAPEGERDETLFRVARHLIERFPDGEPESIAMLFAPSIALMGPGCPDVAEVEKKIQRRRDELAAETQRAELDSLERHKRLVRAAFDYSGRETPYTEQELEGFASAAGVSRDEFSAFWVIQSKSSAWIFANGAYRGPYDIRHELEKAAQVYLSPATTCGVELLRTSKTGEISPKPASELVRAYGSLADALRVDLTAQRSYFDRRTKTLVEAPCPLRPLTPQYVPAVATWLELLGGPEANRLLDWIASVTRLEDPCAALYLEGDPGVGKTLLAEGLARLWTTSAPTTLDDAFATFNSATVHCPLVFADETIPRDFRGQGRTGELRQFIQSRTRTLRRKFVPDAILSGCIRLIIAANNSSLLRSSEELTVNDIEAIVDRILHVRAGPEPVAFFATMDRAARAEFVRGDLIARHALWLRENRTVESTHRFLVSGSKDSLHRTLTTSAGLRSAVCHWLVSYLLDPRTIDSQGAMLVRREGGELLATTRGLARDWEIYRTNADPPLASPLSQALAGISSRRKQLAAGDGRRTWYHVIDRENLIAWADENGFGDRDTILDCLSRK